MTFNMVVSVLWAAYNSIPPLLLLHFAFAGYKGMRFNVRLCGLLATLLMLGVIICVWLLLPPTYDFGQVSPAAEQDDCFPPLCFDDTPLCTTSYTCFVVAHFCS